MLKKIIGRFKKPKQHTFVYCPKCNKEMVANGHIIEDNDGVVKYKCSRCGNISFWDFIRFPVPVLRTCADCHYFYDEGYNYGCVITGCDPDMQKKFTYEIT